MIPAAVRYGEKLFFLNDHAKAQIVLREALARGDEGAQDWLCDVLIATERPERRVRVRGDAQAGGRGAEVAAPAADAERLGATPGRLRELTG
ncbi:hypothetical protein ACIBQX_40115 [Nonomuraea sp. NPDC049714]|uniref:hypothetical protein n=1 Tax=Nonomuraea sp. NPDC049714 TaxID=3364357 RepID=UPI00378E2A5C